MIKNRKWIRTKSGGETGNALGVNEGGAEGRIQDQERGTNRPTERGRSREGNRGRWVSILFPFFSSPSLLLFSLCLFSIWIWWPGVQSGRCALHPTAIRNNSRVSHDFRVTANCTRNSSGQWLESAWIFNVENLTPSWITNKPGIEP